MDDEEAEVISASVVLSVPTVMFFKNAICTIKQQHDEE
jgi:hypothetical protein